MEQIAVLFARRDSIYKTLAGCDVWDADRNALKWPGGCPAIAHPPCRAWGNLRHFAKPDPGEKELALWAVDQIRRFGGVLEHPYRSTLWPAAGLPEPGSRDRWNGFTVSLPQWWFGHRADKLTRLYICGCEPAELPAIPFRLGVPDFVVCPSSGIRKGQRGWKPQIRTPERESTPLEFAQWLLQTARLCSPLPRHHGLPKSEAKAVLLHSSFVCPKTSARPPVLGGKTG